jgi:hypothetical protein
MDDKLIERHTIASISAGAIVSIKQHNKKLIVCVLFSGLPPLLLSDLLSSLLPTLLLTHTPPQFGGAWWVLADGAAYASYIGGTQPPVEFVHFLPSLASIIGLLLLNSFSWDDISGSGMDTSASNRARCLMFSALIIMFVCIFGAVFVLMDNFGGDDEVSSWPGISVLLSTVMIFISAIVWRLGRSLGNESGF